MIPLIVLTINHKHKFFIILYLINSFSQLLSNTNPIIINSCSNDELFLHAPIKFTPSGINCFLKHTYNHPEYANTIVPHNTCHFMQLLEHGKNTKQDHDYILAVLRLFRQKISGTDYISANEVERIITYLPTILENYLDPKKARHHKSSCRKLRNLIVHLVENCLSKTLWDCDNADKMAQQLLQIGRNLENMLNAKIISDQDDLNDLIHILVDRFIYVIDLAGADLPISFYDNLKKQLDDASWMKLPEIEDLIDTKLQKIERAFLKNKVKSQANQSFGIISTPLPIN